jgi:transcriptional regulator with XRE-family HTH domain
MMNWENRLAYALRVRKVRKLQALAVELGVDESALSRWKRGRSISLDNAVGLSRALDASLDWLVTGRGHIDAHKEPSTTADSAADYSQRLAREIFPALNADQGQTALEALRRLVEAISPPPSS